MKKDVPFNVLANPNDWERAPRGPLATAIGAAMGFSTTTLFGGAAISLFGGAVVLSTASVVGSLVLWAVTSWAKKALAPKFDAGAYDSQGLLVNAREAAGPQHFVYGKVRKGGTVSYFETTGTDNKYLHQIIVLAGHEINSIDNIYINDEQVTIDGSGNVTTAKWDSKIRIYYHLGNQTSTTTPFANVSSKNLNNTLIAESELSGDDALDSNFVGKGLAYLYIRHEYDREVYANGLPTITALIRGKKVFDPREASHVSNDPSTWEYSENAALCIRDFISSEYGLGDDKIDDISFAAAANECDEDITIYGSTTEKRYTINGVIDASRPVGGVLEDMVPACAGTLFYGAGKWMLKAGAYTTPVKTFTDDDFRSGIDLDTKISFRDTFNAVQGTYPSKHNDYITTDYPKVSDATYLSQDNNEESVLDLPLNYTTSTYTAQRLAKLTLLRGRQQMTFTADFGTEAMEVEVGDIVQITHARYSFSAKKFEVITWQLAVSESAGLVVRMTLRETAQSAFGWNTSDATGPTVNATIVPTSENNATIGQVTATNTGYTDADGTFVSRVTLDWPDVVGGNFSHYEVDHKLSSETQYKTIITPVSLVNLHDYKKDDVVNYRLRTVNTLGKTSDYTSVGSITVTGDTTAPSAPTSLSATGGFRAVSLGWTNPTAVDFSHVEVWRSTANNSASAVKIAETNSDYYVDAPLAGNTQFYYWVKASDLSGNVSGFSSSANATTTLIGSDDIPTGTITETMIADNSISTGKIQANAISANELAADSVTSGAIQAGAITSAKIAADAISADNIDVTELSAFTADMGSITAGNINLGNIAVDSTNSVPTSGVGISLQEDGDFAVGDTSQYMSFDASSGVMTLRGRIQNITDALLRGEAVSQQSMTITSNSQLGFGNDGGEITGIFGAGIYVAILWGGGGGGGARGGNSTAGPKPAGAGGGMAIAAFDYDGNSTMLVDIGTGGTGASVNQSSSGNGNAGGASYLTLGGTSKTNNIFLQANGGASAGGSGGTGVINNTNGTNTLFQTGNANTTKGRGGSSYRGGGGGVVVPTIEDYDSNLTAQANGNNIGDVGSGGSMIANSATSGTNGGDAVANYLSGYIQYPFVAGNFIGKGGQGSGGTGSGASSGGRFAGGGGRQSAGSASASAGSGGWGAGGGSAVSGGSGAAYGGAGGTGGLIITRL